MDNLEKFNKQLTEIMNNSNLPVSVLKMCLQNSILQLEVLRLEVEKLEIKENSKSDKNNESAIA
ncbi:MAG: hypothetical protein PHH31_08650 [Acidaminococcaceae bacterium]|nr:hypothetical protein [Acidaminococcaceae bacterium]